MEIHVSTPGKFFPLACAPAVFLAGAMVIWSVPAQAGKVHWKDDPAMPSCSALAFDDTDEWFATQEGSAFKRGVCHGQRIHYQVVLAPNGESFTASGANYCTYRVGEAHAIAVSCRPRKTR